MDRTTSYACPICSVTFSRSCHLQRHYDTHSVHKAWKCDFCTASFKRSDALRKHWRTCSLRKLLGAAMPAQQPPGRRRQACDRCAANKQGCDGRTTCSNCAAKSYTCSYERAAGINARCNNIARTLDVETWKFPLGRLGVASFPAAFPNTCDEQPLRLECSRHSEDMDSRSDPVKFQISFLVQLTKSSGLYHVFNYIRPDEHVQGSSESNLFDSLIDWQMPTWNDPSKECRSNPINSSVVHTSRLGSWISHPLFAQSTALWNIIQGAPMFESSMPNALDPKYIQDYSHIEFFNPFNLERYLELFWSQWSHHCPIIHRHSFDNQKAPTSMVFIMALIGCLMSNNTEEVSCARDLVEIAEWAVFQELGLWSAFQGLPEEDSGLLYDKLRLLQSALLICTVQRWEGVEESKGRVRDQLFPAVVAAARDLGFDRAEHSTDLNLDQRLVDWPRWVFKEELIRTYIYMFLFDNQYAIFHGAPPRIKLSEMNMTLPYPEPCFRASTGEELLSILQELGHAPIWNNSIRTLVELLCSGHDYPAQLRDMAGMSALSLMTLVVAIQAAILCQSMSLCVSPSTISTLRGSLHKWNAAWNQRLRSSTNLLACDASSSSSEANPGVEGWLRHAPEYHQVATLMLDKLSPKHEHFYDGRPVRSPPHAGQLEDVLDLFK